VTPRSGDIRVLGWVTRLGLIGIMFMWNKIYRWWTMAEQPTTDNYFSMSMIGLSHFFGRLDPLVEVGVDFRIHNEGILISAFVPESQLRNMLVRSEFE